MATKKHQEETNIRGKKRDILKTENSSVSWLNDISKDNKTTEELIAAITAKIEAEPVYYKHVTQICDHLNRILKFFYQNQNVKIMLFGSSFTKLALQGSDVDIYLDFGGNLPEPPEKLVKTLKNKVRKYGYFIKAIPIFARVPIVHCVHQSQISCDLSFLNALGVLNSNLIKFLLSVDQRIRPLILILKFIMKNHGLLVQSAFTSYALIILVVFFLQTLQCPLLPSISYIQSLASKREMVAGWDTSFTTDIACLPTISNHLSVVELLHKFFEFYSTFEFGFYVISSFTGKSYLKPVFSNPDWLPQEFHLYKKNLEKNTSNKFDSNKFLCVQEPFNHASNITRNVSQKSLVQFQHLCWANAAAGEELLNKNEAEESRWKYLVKLFDQNEGELKSKKLKKEDVVIFVGENIDFVNCSSTEDSLRSEWSKYVFNNVKDILCKVMKCNIDVHSTDIEHGSFSSADDEKLIKCEMSYFEIVSKKRNEVKNEFDFPQNMSVINKEEIISNYLCDTLLKHAEKVSFKFDINCWVKKRPTCFCMNLTSEESHGGNNNSVQQVFNFIKNNFPKWIQ